MHQHAKTYRFTGRRVSLLAIAAACISGGASGCAAIRHQTDKFDVGTSDPARVEADADAPLGAKRSMLTASDSLGERVFAERTSETSFASVPTE